MSNKVGILKRRIKSWYILPGLLVSTAFAVISISEWYKIGINADPDKIAHYHFGSEAMVGNGGWHYQSAAIYAKSALITGIRFLVIMGVFTAGFLLRSYIATFVAYGLLILEIILNHIQFLI